jgi:NADPH2:quinone reductase
MRAWRVNQLGEPETMRLEDLPDPEPGPGQVRIRNRAAAINFFDILQCQGKYQVRPPLPFSPGAEVSGIIDKLGEGVERLAVGDRVQGMASFGGFAECSVVPVGGIFRIPDAMDFAMAAAMPIVYQTSYFALKHRAQLRAGEWLLVHAAAGGVGSAAVQIGKAMGARIIATAGSEDKLVFCREQGAEHALNYRDDGWVDRVKEITGGHGADVIYDPVGGDITGLSTKCIAWEGRLLVIGFAGGTIPKIEANRILLKNIAVVGLHWGEYRKHDPGLVNQAQEDLFAMFRAGQIAPVVSREVPFEEAIPALRELAERKTHGKLVLVMGE